jgi:hypothetical protein
MNEEEEEAPLEDPHVRWNYLARERHATRYEEQRATDANRRATQTGVRNDVQIATNKPSFEAICNLLNGFTRSYIHDVQLFKSECFFEINTV